MSFGIRKLLRGTGLAICLLGYAQNLKGDGACDLSFGIRGGTGLAICLLGYAISSKLLRGTGLAICLLGYAFLPKS